MTSILFHIRAIFHAIAMKGCSRFHDAKKDSKAP